MFVDVVDLRDFYVTRLGQVARRQVRARIRRVWPDVAGMRVLGQWETRTRWYTGTIARLEEAGAIVKWYDGSAPFL